MAFNLNNIIEQHRKNVLIKQQMKTDKLRSKLRKESVKTSKFAAQQRKEMDYRNQLNKQLSEQKKALELQNKLKAIRNKSRDEKIRKLKSFGVSLGKSIGSKVKTLANEYQKQQKREMAKERRKRKVAYQKRKLNSTKRKRR